MRFLRLECQIRVNDSIKWAQYAVKVCCKDRTVFKRSKKRNSIYSIADTLTVWFKNRHTMLGSVAKNNPENMKKRPATENETIEQQREVKSKIENVFSMSYHGPSINDLALKIKKKLNSPIQVSDDMSCQLLVLVCNNVKKSADMNSEKGLSHTNFNFVPLKVLTTGSIRAPLVRL